MIIQRCSFSYKHHRFPPPPPTKKQKRKKEKESKEAFSESSRAEQSRIYISTHNSVIHLCKFRLEERGYSLIQAEQQQPGRMYSTFFLCPCDESPGISAPTYTKHDCNHSKNRSYHASDKPRFFSVVHSDTKQNQGSNIPRNGSHEETSNKQEPADSNTTALKPWLPQSQRSSFSNSIYRNCLIAMSIVTRRSCARWRGRLRETDNRLRR